MLTLRTLLGDYPNTKALKTGEVRAPDLAFEFADVKIPNTAFKDVVRHLKYDFSELAIVTFLQAKAHGKPLVLLPAVVVGALPHPFLVYNSEHDIITPADLAGKRVGIRAYSVTTATWVRGVLQNDYGVDLDAIRWVTFEDPHVAEYSDPLTAERAAPGKQMTQMLLDGELDVALVGGPDLKEPRFKPVIANPHEAGQTWCEKYGIYPINHMAIVTERLAQSNPAAVKEIFRLLRESKERSGASAETDPLQFGVDRVRRSLSTIIEYSVQQRLIPRRFEVDELFDATTAQLN